jgi:hypothetical protein
LKQSSASIATLLILLVTFTTIEYLVLKYNLPDMTP